MAHAHFNLPHALRSKSVSTELKRQIGIRTATAFVVGGVIGRHFSDTGGNGEITRFAAVLVVWLTMGVMALCGALCYGELAARYPEAGGGYVYLREALDQRSLSCTAGWRFW